MNELFILLIGFVCGALSIVGLRRSVLRKLHSEMNSQSPIALMFTYETYRRARIASEAKENQCPQKDAEAEYRKVLDRLYEVTEKRLLGK